MKRSIILIFFLMSFLLYGQKKETIVRIDSLDQQFGKTLHATQLVRDVTNNRLISLTREVKDTMTLQLIYDSAWCILYPQKKSIDFQVETESKWSNPKATFNSTNGYLYNWYAVTNSKNIAPAGWHVPTKVEVDTLKAYCLRTYGTYGGGALKESGTTNWRSPNTGGTNMSLFSARGSGYRYVCYDNPCLDYNLTENFTMWTTTGYPTDTTQAYYLATNYNDATALIDWDCKSSGYAVRLIKDNAINPFIMYDNDGNSYATVKIGNQVWMRQSLIGTHYRDGTAITNGTCVGGYWSERNRYDGLYAAHKDDPTYAYENRAAKPGDVSFESADTLAIISDANIEILNRANTIYFKLDTGYIKTNYEYQQCSGTVTLPKILKDTIGFSSPGLTPTSIVVCSYAGRVAVDTSCWIEQKRYDWLTVGGKVDVPINYWIIKK